jgi:hypothetical protein
VETLKKLVKEATSEAFVRGAIDAHPPIAWQNLREGVYDGMLTADQKHQLAMECYTELRALELIEEKMARS